MHDGPEGYEHAVGLGLLHDIPEYGLLTGHVPTQPLSVVYQMPPLHDAVIVPPHPFE